jgi:hypothetical protein
MLLPRRAALSWLAAGAFTFCAIAQKRTPPMTSDARPDEKVLQAYYETAGKYHMSPVPTPLERASAITFVNNKANRATPPDEMRKLMRLAVFYDLRETAPAFSNVLTGRESQRADVLRSALCLVALAWIGDPGQQASAQEYYRGLQDRADVDLDRNLILEVVEAFGPREGTGSYRQWIQTRIADLQRRLRQEEAGNNIRGSKLVEEKINALTEHLNIQVALVDRAFSIRQRVEASGKQITLLVGYSLANIAESTPQLSFWASMRLLRMQETLRAQIAGEFYTAASVIGSADPGGNLVKVRALRAAEYFGYPLPELDRRWLTSQPDNGADPLVLRPQYYTRQMAQLGTARS